MKHFKVVVLQRQMPDRKDINKRKLGKFHLTLSKAFDKCNELVSISDSTYATVRKMVHKCPYKSGIRLWRRKKPKMKGNATEYLRDKIDTVSFQGDEGWPEEILADTTSFADDKRYLYLGHLDEHPRGGSYPLDEVDEEPAVHKTTAVASAQLEEEYESDRMSSKANEYFSAFVGNPSTAESKRRKQPRFPDNTSNGAFSSDGGVSESSYWWDIIGSHFMAHKMREDCKESSEFYRTKKQNSKSYYFIAIWSAKSDTNPDSNSTSSRENVCNSYGPSDHNDNVAVPVRQKINDMCAALKALTENTCEEETSDVHLSSSSTKEIIQEEDKDLSKFISTGNSGAIATGVSANKNAQKTSRVKRQPKLSFSKTADTKERANTQPLKTRQRNLCTREAGPVVAEEPKKLPLTTKSKTPLPSAKKASVNCPDVKPKLISVKDVKQEVKPSTKVVSSIQSIKLEKKALKQKADLKFAQQFQAYAKQSEKTKSGIMISKYKNYLWLKTAGLFQGIISTKDANDNFSLIAGTGIVLNMHDYLRYLRKISIGSKIKFQDLVHRLAECPPPERKSKNCETSLEEKKIDDADGTGSGEKDVVCGEKEPMAVSKPLLPCLMKVPDGNTKANVAMKGETLSEDFAQMGRD